MWKRKRYLYTLLVLRTLNWDLIYQYLAVTWVKTEKYLTLWKTGGKKRVRYWVEDVPPLEARSEVGWSIWLFCYVHPSWYITHCFGDRGTNWQNHFITQNLNTTLVLSDYGDSHFFTLQDDQTQKTKRHTEMSEGTDFSGNIIHKFDSFSILSFSSTWNLNFIH